MVTSSSQDVVFSLQVVPESTTYFAGTLQRQKTQLKLRERLMAPRSSDMRGSSKASQLLKSFAGLIQLYSENVARTLKSNVLVAHLVHWE